MTEHHCAHDGHVWLEANGLPFARHRDRPRGPVEVQCQHCLTVAQLEAHGANTAPPKDLGQ